MSAAPLIIKADTKYSYLTAPFISSTATAKNVSPSISFGGIALNLVLRIPRGIELDLNTVFFILDLVLNYPDVAETAVFSLRSSTLKKTLDKPLTKIISHIFLLSVSGRNLVLICYKNNS